MDPVMHLALPTLFLLALRLDPKRVLMLSPLAILPDFDVLFGLHRALGHSFIPILVLPMALIVFSKLRRPEWMAAALLVQFFLASHIILDMGGVAFLWPLTTQQFFFEPAVTFAASGGFDIGFSLEYGFRDLAETGTTSIISDAGFAMLFLGVLCMAVFRREALGALRRLWGILREELTDLMARLRRSV
ncbi:MAG: metal-dependent hydrolase [Thermoplasmata archaeon]|nr:metal-dependent hydrolase [Thermoplasmata archaeon]